MKETPYNTNETKIILVSILKSGVPHQLKSGNEKSGVPHQLKSGNEKSGVPYQTKNGNEKSGLLYFS